MINLAISIAVLLFFALVPKYTLDVSFWLTIPFGLLAGVATFFILGRKVASEMEALMARVQKEMADINPGQPAKAAKKMDRAIEIMKEGFALKNRQLFVSAQIHSQIGMFYYMKGKKFHEEALEHLKEGFYRLHMGQCMMASIYHQRQDYDNVKKVMDVTLKTNKKEAFVYALYAWFHQQNKDKDAAMEILQKGLKAKKDERLQQQLILLQNNKKLKMRAFGDIWTQMMLERPPRVQQQQQGGPPHMRMSRKAMFR